MAKNKGSKFEQLEGKFRPVYEYQTALSGLKNENGEAQGDLEQLLNFFASEMKKEGAKDDDIRGVIPTLQQQYMQGERGVFLKPAEKHFNEARNAYGTFVKDNIEEIIDSTPEEILKSKVLPQIVGKYKYKSDDPQYKDLDKLVADVTKLNNKHQSLEDPKKQEAMIAELVKKKMEHYKARYKDNDFLISLFSGLVSPQEELRAFETEVKNKNKELDEALKKGVKGYLKSVHVTPEDLGSIYSGIFAEAYEAAAQNKR